MSPTVYQLKYGARVVINTNDHNPPHVHIEGNQGEWVRLKIEDGVNMDKESSKKSRERWSSKQIREFSKYVLQRKYQLMEKWNEIKKDQI